MSAYLVYIKFVGDYLVATFVTVDLHTIFTKKLYSLSCSQPR